MYARGYAHFADVSKIALDAPRAGTQAPEQPRPERERPRPNTGTQPPGATTTTGTQATTTRARAEAANNKKIKKNWKYEKAAVPLQHKPKTTKQYESNERAHRTN